MMMTRPGKRLAAATFAGGAALALVALALAPLTVLSAGPTSAAKAVSMGPQKPGKFVWFDLLTKDPAAAESFYAGLFGWTFELQKDQKPPYKVIRAQGEPIGGLVDMRGRTPDLPESTWLSYVSVPDVDAAAAAIKARDGKIVKEPFDLGSVARVAVVTDPQGALLGLLRAKRGDPVDAAPTEGRFLWMEYIAQDAESAMAFYRDTLGYTAKKIDAGVDITYYALQKGGANHAGLYATPWKEVKSNWLPYVLVSDAPAFAAKAKSLGGKVVFEPRENVRNGSLAIIVDPSGAALALQKWPFEKAAK